MQRRAKDGFVEWGTRFFAYLTLHKERTNPALLELIYYLGDAGRQELALSIFNFLRPKLWRQFCKDRQAAGQRVTAKLSKAISNLNGSASRYRELHTLVPELGVGTALGTATPSDFPEQLETEATRLATQRKLATIAFSKKRFGIKENHGMLIRLQEFIDEFGRIWDDYLPRHARRHLSVADIADLLEAGKAALGLPEAETITYPASIERALQRFKKNPHNQKMRSLLRADAITVCHALPLRAPSVSPRP